MFNVSVWNNTLADLLINLSAGWFGAVFIIPAFSNFTFQSVPLLTIDFLLGILFLRLAYKLRLSETE